MMILLFVCEAIQFIEYYNVLLSINCGSMYLQLYEYCMLDALVCGIVPARACVCVRKWIAVAAERLFHKDSANIFEASLLLAARCSPLLSPVVCAELKLRTFLSSSAFKTNELDRDVFSIFT